MVLDSGESVVLSMDIVLEHGLGKGKQINDASLKEIILAQRKIKVKSSAYNFAVYKPRTKKQTISRLREKGFDDDEIKLAIDFLAEFNLIDDIKYAENFIKEYINRKPAGESKVRAELFKKGIDKFTIDDAMEKCYPKQDSYLLAMRAAEKKMRSFVNRVNKSDKVKSDKDEAKERNSLVAYLRRQGFDWDIIKRVTSEIIENEE